MHNKGSPLGGGGFEVAVLDMEISGADSLRPQPVEQRHFGSRGDAQVGIFEALLFL